MLYASEQAERGKPGQHLLKTAHMHVDLLRTTWAREGAKAVCLKHGVTTAAATVQPLFNRVAMRFLSQQYTQPSQFEMPNGTRNGCR